MGVRVAQPATCTAMKASSPFRFGLSIKDFLISLSAVLHLLR